MNADGTATLHLQDTLTCGFAFKSQDFQMTIFTRQMKHRKQNSTSSNADTGNLSPNNTCLEPVHEIGIAVAQRRFHTTSAGALTP